MSCLWINKKHNTYFTDVSSAISRLHQLIDRKLKSNYLELKKIMLYEPKEKIL